MYMTQTNEIFPLATFPTHTSARQGQTLPQTSLLFSKLIIVIKKKITKCWRNFVKVKHENEIKISVILCLWGQNEARSLEAAYRFEETAAFKGFTIGPYMEITEKFQQKPISQD